jgi:DNA-binding MarR family transcriptional regulator
MGQYEVARRLHDRSRPLTTREIATDLGLAQGAVQDSVRLLRRKGYVARADGAYTLAEDVTEDDVERLEPPTIQELADGTGRGQ